jgi:D-inositol-3-phosphate glycosyltransferase
VQPGVEDFDMRALEARATGAPVIARREGGASETVTDAVTGVLVEGDDHQAWAAALREFRPTCSIRSPCQRSPRTQN